MILRLWWIIIVLIKIWLVVIKASVLVITHLGRLLYNYTNNMNHDKFSKIGLNKTILNLRRSVKLSSLFNNELKIIIHNFHDKCNRFILILLETKIKGNINIIRQLCYLNNSIFTYHLQIVLEYLKFSLFIFLLSQFLPILSYSFLDNFVYFSIRIHKFFIFYQFFPSIFFVTPIFSHSTNQSK